MTTTTERRSGKRITAHVPTQVRTQGGQHAAETRDVSTHGVFLYTSSPMEKGAEAMDQLFTGVT